MTRIVAGAAKGRRLTVPETGTRPTSDRAREAVFSALASRLRSFVGVSVVDLYAGSGALGLEAASRGAGPVEFVESDQRVVPVLRQNLQAVGLADVLVSAVPVERWIHQGGDRCFDLALMDPPYALPNDEVVGVVRDLATSGRLCPGAWVVVERPHRAGTFDWPDLFEVDQDRRYGEAHMWFGRFGSVAGC